jgi:hypothetical protein
MTTPRLTRPLPPPPCWASLSPSRRRKLLALLSAMVLEALHPSPHAAQVNDERRHR